ncbi:MAG TPA: hypothetical protein VNG73_10945, partial [Gemmatimonadaceae bacterium]|nr:hypothetical protein [Gemmatimonadaceae bacterium]
MSGRLKVWKGFEVRKRFQLEIGQLLEFGRRLLMRRCAGARVWLCEFRPLESLDLRSGLGWRSAGIEEHKAAGVSLHGGFRPTRLDVRVQGVYPLHGSTGFGGSSLGIEGFMEDLELLDRLRVLARLGELVCEHQPDVVLTG